MEDLACRLREAREFLGASQEFVASQIAINRSALSDIERGQRKVSTDELAKFSKLYGVPISDLLGETSSDAEDATLRALARTANQLKEGDKVELLRFAQFLQSRTVK